MTLDFSIQEKRVIYNILAQIMKADTIINSAEVTGATFPGKDKAHILFIPLAFAAFLSNAA